MPSGKKSVLHLVKNDKQDIIDDLEKCLRLIEKNISFHKSRPEKEKACELQAEEKALTSFEWALNLVLKFQPPAYFTMSKSYQDEASTCDVVLVLGRLKMNLFQYRHVCDEYGEICDLTATEEFDEVCEAATTIQEWWREICRKKKENEAVRTGEKFVEKKKRHQCPFTFQCLTGALPYQSRFDKKINP